MSHFRNTSENGKSSPMLSNRIDPVTVMGSPITSSPWMNSAIPGQPSSDRLQTSASGSS
jgi:hypothetical protein